MKYFTINELTRSATANSLKLDNTPSKRVTEELEKLVNTVLDPLREKWGKPIRVSSGYRCEKLNTAVGGVKNSQHRLGQAADITSINDDKKENHKLWELAIQMVKNGEIEVGQIINEKGDDWIHISTPTSRLHNQIIYIK